MTKSKSFFYKLKSSLFFLCLAISSFSQTSRLDSLLKVVKTMKEDTSMVNTIHEICMEYFFELRDLEKLKEYSQKELLLSNQLNFKKGIARAYLAKGMYYRSSSDLKKAHYYDQMALDLMREIHNKKGEGSCLINIGLTKSMLGNYNEALDCLNKAIKIEEEINAKEGMAAAYNNMGIVLQTMGDYEQAMRYNLKSLKISEELHDQKRMAMSYINIGVLLYAQKKADEAMGYYLKVIQWLENTDSPDLANAYNNLGNIYLDKQKNKEALGYYLKSLKVREKINDRRGMAITYNNIGNVYLSQEQLDPALTYHLKAYNLSKQIGDKKNTVSAGNSLGETYRKRKNYSVAINYYQQALELAREINFKEGILEMYHSFSNLYKEEKQFDKALEYMTLFKKMNDSILNEENLRQVNELTARYETEKKEKEILLLKKDKELNAKAMKQQQLIRWSLIGGLFLLFISVISIYWRYRFKQRANILLEKQKQEIEHTLQELTVTSDELNKVMEQKEKLTSILAHDLRTPLRFMTTISEYLYKNMHAITDEELKELSFEMSRSSKSTFAFAEELLTWLGIQKNNYKVECAATNIHQLMDELHAFFSDIARMNGTQIKVEDSGNLFVDTDERLLKIILRNLIDNAIKYTTDGTITLSVFRNEKEEVEIQVRDTGEGMTNEQLEKLNDRNTFGFPFEIKDKLGFQIVRDLSTLIKCQVHIESVIKKGTTVKLIFSKHIENS